MMAAPLLVLDGFDRTVTAITTWLQVRVVVVGVLAMVVGGFLMILGIDRGRRLVVTAVLGTLLVVFARPLLSGLVELVGAMAR